MVSPDTSIGGSRREFPLTSWATILAAGDGDDAQRRKSLELLIQRYWKPAYCYIRAVGRCTVEDAKDLTQEFFARLLEKHVLQRIEEGRGNFRGFLKRALRNFAIDAARRDRVRQAAVGKPVFRLEPGDEPAAPEPSLGPESAFDREWAREVLRGAIEDLRVSMSEQGQTDTFAAFRLYCLEGRDASSGHRASYKDVADRLGVTETVVRKRLERCREELRARARERIRDYVDGDDELDAEFREVVGP